MITAWVTPDTAKVKYECFKPDNWDELDDDAKIEYFDENMFASPTSSFDIGGPDPDWYEDFDVSDFKEEK